MELSCKLHKISETICHSVFPFTVIIKVWPLQQHKSCLQMLCTNLLFGSYNAHLNDSNNNHHFMAIIQLNLPAHAVKNWRILLVQSFTACNPACPCDNNQLIRIREKMQESSSTLLSSTLSPYAHLNDIRKIHINWTRQI